MTPGELPTAKFRLGRIVATPRALEVLTPEDIHAAIIRHLSGDWGELKPEDARANDQAVINGRRIFSAYRARSGVTFWLITEANRRVTTVLLPGD